MSAVFEQRADEFLDAHLPFLAPVTRMVPDLVKGERRKKPRLHDPLPTRVWGIDREGGMVSFDCLLDNLSSSGAFLKIPSSLEISSEISLVVRLLHGSGLMAALKGKVLRDEPQRDGSRGIAVRITEHHLL